MQAKIDIQTHHHGRKGVDGQRYQRVIYIEAAVLVVHGMEG